MGAISTPANWLTIVNKPALVADLGVSDFNAKAIEAQSVASAGGVGTYAFLTPGEASGAPNDASMTPGVTKAGSTLRYACADGGGVTAGTYSNNNTFSNAGAAPAGTWRLMGYQKDGDGAGTNRLFTNSLWLRIA